MNSNPKWFMKLITDDNDLMLSVYNDGLVVCLLNGNKFKFSITKETTATIKSLINKDMYMFKSNPIADYGNNNIIMRIRDNSRKHRNIRIKGWNQAQLVYSLILKDDLVIKNNQ